MARGGDGAAELLQRAEEQLALAVGEIRELARGLHPSVLADQGLGAALEQLVPRLEGVLPVEIDVPVLRLDPELEACAYYLVAEALANAAKYADASAATVSIREDVDTITVEVRDDGCGGACLTPGGGLEGLADRVPPSAARSDREPGRRHDVAGGSPAAAPPLRDAPPSAAPSRIHRWLLSTRNAGLTATNQGFTTLPV